MLSLTGKSVFVLAVAGAILPLVAVAWLTWRGNHWQGIHGPRNKAPESDRPGSHGSGRRRLMTRVVPTVVLAVCAQLFAMTALALKVNDQYLFYTSWADLAGQVSQQTTIQTKGLVEPGEGSLRVMTVPSRDAGSQRRVLVWLPPQYDLPAYRHHRFPLVMFMTGQPSTPQTAFAHFEFARTATKVISARQAQPFVAVFPTVMIRPPRDTECTDVPRGPQAETWLAKDVPAFITQHFRVEGPGKAWTALGWSTGGFCAAKLVASDPAAFGSAVSFGGYYQPVQDKTTGSLFGGRLRLRLHNSPEWLYTHHQGLRGSSLLLVAGQQDKETWASTNRMIQTAAGDPSVAHIAFPKGGHNYRNYASYLAPSLAWSGARWPVEAQP